MVEHWDVLEPMPAAGQSRNKNGEPEDNGRRYLKFSLDALQGAAW
jgi:hypothetical protein